MKISALFSSVRHAQILQLFQAEIVKIIEVVTNDVIVGEESYNLYTFFVLKSSFNEYLRERKLSEML